MKENAIKHMEFVQSAIGRIAGNSFLLKGWTVTLAAALFALSAAETKLVFTLLVLLPATAFWGLDAYYLRQERLFRLLYDEIRLAKNDDLSKLDPLSMKTDRFEKDVPGWLKTMVSPSIVWLHGVVVFAVIVMTVVLILSNSK